MWRLVKGKTALLTNAFLQTTNHVPSFFLRKTLRTCALTEWYTCVRLGTCCLKSYRRRSGNECKKNMDFALRILRYSTASRRLILQNRYPRQARASESGDRRRQDEFVPPDTARGWNTRSPGQRRSPWSASLPSHEMPLEAFQRSGVSSIPVALVPKDGGSTKINNQGPLQAALEAATSLYEAITESTASFRLIWPVKKVWFTVWTLACLLLRPSTFSLQRVLLLCITVPAR
ncbi:hypothetical protein V5799_009917 [Amblyomma americanum]|uniref:Uncharacterized protein n=1 Tax=Amblyomma americanum TaxID=6943 RepID=A0AAQ4F9J3_AMBAM